MCFKKKKRKKYLGQDSNKDHLKANSSLNLLCHATKYLSGKANYYIYQKNSASKCCLKLVELYLSRIETYTKKLSRVLTVKALLKLISLHLKNILWPTANKCLVNCCKVSYCRPCRRCSSLYLHEENRPFHGL